MQAATPGGSMLTTPTHPSTPSSPFSLSSTHHIPSLPIQPRPDHDDYIARAQSPEDFPCTHALPTPSSMAPPGVAQRSCCEGSSGQPRSLARGSAQEAALQIAWRGWHLLLCKDIFILSFACLKPSPRTRIPYRQREVPAVRRRAGRRDLMRSPTSYGVCSVLTCLARYPLFAIFLAPP